jgi:prenyltransferase beta subunit
MSQGRRRDARHWVLWALAACALAGALLPTWASSAAPDSEAQATADRSVRFLQEAQNMDGGFGGRIGGTSDPGFSAWAAYALAAAGINPQDQSQPGGVDVFTYLTAHTTKLKETTDYDRVALVALASGTSPYAFGTVNPIEAMLSRRLEDGSFAQQAGGEQGWVNATVWSIFPLSALDAPATDQIATEAAEWLLDQQREDGSWSWGPTAPGAPIDTDTTGAVIEALNAAGLQSAEADEAEEAAFEFLKTVQGPDGGFRATPNTETNSATTAWVIQGMWSAGVDPRVWTPESEGGEPIASDPLKFLASLQRDDGSIGWTADNDLNSLWMTAQVAPALFGATYPLPPVPRALKAPVRKEHTESVKSQEKRAHPRRNGHGGKGAQRGDGVIAGGGGRGAPAFTGPQPQSGGSTAHGARVVDAEGGEEAVPDRSQPAPTASAQGPGGGGTASGGDGGGGGGSLEPGSVEGVLVSDRGAPAAPGLFGADPGGKTGTQLALILAAGLLVAAGFGARREREGLRP